MDDWFKADATFFELPDFGAVRDTAPAYHADTSSQPLFLIEHVAKVTIPLHSLNEAFRQRHNFSE